MIAEINSLGSIKSTMSLATEINDVRKNAINAVFETAVSALKISVGNSPDCEKFTLLQAQYYPLRVLNEVAKRFISEGIACEVLTSGLTGNCTYLSCSVPWPEPVQVVPTASEENNSSEAQPAEEERGNSV